MRFLTEFVGLGFVEAVQDLAQQVGMTVPDDDRSREEREEPEGSDDPDAPAPAGSPE